MFRKRFLALVGGLAVVLLAGLVAAGCGAPADNSASQPEEGIKVLGHWTIEVRSPDGSLVERREFDNALSVTGNWVLTRFLGRQKSVGFWYIGTSGTKADQPFLDDNGDPNWGLLAEADAPETGNWIFKTLTVTVPTEGDNEHKLVLSGTATAQKDGVISGVNTSVSLDAPTNAPSSPSAVGFPNYVTTTLLSPSVAVTEGQQLLFTVVISFE